MHKYFKAKREEEEREAELKEEEKRAGDSLDKVISKLQPEDLNALQTYLEDMEADPVSQEDLSDLPVVEYPEPSETVGAPDLGEFLL